MPVIEVKPLAVPRETGSRSVAAVKLLALVLLVGCTKPAAKPEAATQPKPPRVLTVNATAPRQRLMVVLHGVGSNADNVLPLARSLATVVPDAEVLVPDGLFPFSGGPSGREWYSLQNITEAERAARVEPAAVALSAWLDEQLAQRRLSGDKLIVVGFSQGAGLAQWLAVRRKPAPLSVALAGRFSVAGDERAAPGTRVLIVHGTADNVVPVENAQRAADALTARGASVEVELIPELRHSIDERVLSRVQRFLAP